MNKDPNGIAPEMNILFAQWLTEHVTSTDALGRVARQVRDAHIAPHDPDFPVWKYYESVKIITVKKPRIRLQKYRKGDSILSLKHLFT